MAVLEVQDRQRPGVAGELAAVVCTGCGAEVAFGRRDDMPGWADALGPLHDCRQPPPPVAQAWCRR